MNTSALYTYSAISMITSFLFFGMGILLFISRSYLLENLWVQKTIRKKPIFFMCFLGILFERFAFNLSNKLFNLYLIISNLIILVFMLLRAGIIIKNTFVLTLPLWFFICIISLALISSVIRGFIRLGYAIETFPKDNPHILHFWAEASEIAQLSKRRIIKNIMRIPENPNQRYYTISLSTLGITAAGVGVGAYVGWETHQANKINRNNYELSKRVLDVTEINGDRQAVKDGFMTRENYDKKWDDFGNLRK